MEKKKSFIFNVEWAEVLMDYPAEVRLEVYDAIIRYAASGTLSELKPLAGMAFSFAKREIDYNNEKYADTVSKRSEAGKSAMQRRWGKDKNNTCQQAITNVTSDNKNNTCQQAITNVTDNVYDNDIDIEKKKLSKESQKEKAADASFHAPSQDENSQNPDYEKFLNWLSKNAPYCFQNMKQPTEAEFMRLKEKYSGTEISLVIEQIENRKDLRKKYTSLYRTVLNWAKNEYKK